LHPEVFSPSGFNPTRHAPPYTAISHYAHGQLFLITTPVKDGWVYRIDYPYYSWAETVVRPRVERRNFTPLLARLNQLENDGSGLWKLDSQEMTSAVKFLGVEGKLAASRLLPDEVANALRVELLSRQTVAAEV
jgi:hypothetical protein